MPLFLQALPLSFLTFVHYLVLLPFLLIVALALSLLGLIPLVGFLVPGTVSAFCLIAGFRCALAARGHGNEPAFGQLLRSSLIFCLLNIVASLAISGIAAASAGLVTLIVTGLSQLVGSGQSVLIWLGGSALTAYAILSALFASAIAVPMTASAQAGTTNRRDVDPLFGFGTGVFSLTLVSLAWLLVGTAFAIFREVSSMLLVLTNALTAALAGDEVKWDWDVDLISLAGAALFMVWASSWFFATAVLAWERATARRAAARDQADIIDRVSPDDLRALREARMKGQRGPGN
jgi:hypothetical protein